MLLCEHPPSLPLSPGKWDIQIHTCYIELVLIQRSPLSLLLCLVFALKFTLRGKIQVHQAFNNGIHIPLIFFRLIFILFIMSISYVCSN